MDAEKYLKLAEKPRIVAMDDEGNETPMQIKSMERPDLKKLQEMCTRKQTGHIVFIDVFFATIEKESVLSKALLYYGDQLMGGRAIPTVNMCSGETLQITFTFHLVITPQGIQIAA